MKLATVGGAVVFVIGFFIVFQWEFHDPGQPIQFPHSVHAGDRKIACVYCHTGVEKGDMAGVPSVQDCYQCHQVVRKDGSEIEKVVEHYQKGEPILWHKVYNMPKTVHFSHRQHVTVGKIQCLQCHGDLTTMKTAQFAHNLHMGFCINCHRQHLNENKALMDCTTCHF